MNIFGNRSIKSRVMEVLNKKIEDTQKIYDDTCARADATCEKEIIDAKERRDDMKAHVADNLVNELVSKFL